MSAALSEIGLLFAHNGHLAWLAALSTLAAIIILRVNRVGLVAILAAIFAEATLLFVAIALLALASIYTAAQMPLLNLSGVAGLCMPAIPLLCLWQAFVRRGTSR